VGEGGAPEVGACSRRTYSLRRTFRGCEGVRCGYLRSVRFKLAVVGALVLACAALILRGRAVASARETTLPWQRAEPRTSEAAVDRNAVPGTERASPAVTTRADDGATSEPTSARPAPRRGDPVLFGKLVVLGQGLELGKALAKNARMADEYVDELCEEGNKLHEHPAMPDASSHDRDAADFMAPLVDYEKPIDDPPGRLHLANSLAERINSYGNDWPAKISDADLEGLDFGWMAALRRFDHWSLFGAGRIREEPVEKFFDLAIPNYSSLRFWSKLRLASAFRRGDFAQASSDVRHLGDLIRTQGIPISEMIAVAVYRLDARAREVAVARGFDVGGWPQPDVEQLDRYRRTTLASLSFTYPGVKPETLRKAVACMPSPCPALIEGAGANRTFGAYGGVDNLDLVSDLAREHGCESASLERARHTRELAASEALDVAGDDMGVRIPKLLDGLDLH